MSERPLTPLMRAVLEAVRDDEQDALANAARHGYVSIWGGATANAIGGRVNRALNLQLPERSGNGAVSGSWSGDMADCQRILGPLGALVRRGLLDRLTATGYASRYGLTDQGEALLLAEHDG